MTTPAPDLAALERPLADLEWQPIETAPKDGTPILVSGLDWGTGPGRHVTLAVWSEDPPDGHAWTECGDPLSVLKYLTLWRPLPTPEGDSASRTALIAERRQTRALAVRMAEALSAVAFADGTPDRSGRLPDMPRAMELVRAALADARSAGLIETAKEGSNG